MFYTYNQNNSGGVFDYNERAGIGTYVIIEADSAPDADAKALEIGLYFNGCESGQDCSCCGDRWDSLSQWKEEGTDVPSIWGTPVEEDDDDADMVHSDRHKGFIHFVNGTIKSFS